VSLHRVTQKPTKVVSLHRVTQKLTKVVSLRRVIQIPTKAANRQNAIPIPMKAANPQNAILIPTSATKSRVIRMPRNVRSQSVIPTAILASRLGDGSQMIPLMIPRQFR